MRTLIAALSLGVLLLIFSPGRGDEKAVPPILKALEASLEEVITACEPSVACILVSRSEEYRKWGQALANDGTGRLGKFDVQTARSMIRPGGFGRLNNDDRATLDHIKAHDLSSPDYSPESYGSGMVIDPSGLILTNAHVVRNATKVYVRLPGNKGSYADIHASDPRSDLAILRLIDPIEGLKPLKLAEPGRYRKGQLVLLLANPFAAGFRDGSPTASLGMIANVRRRAPSSRSESEQHRTLHHHGTLLQIDTRLDLGCSGGALVNLKGELIGITTALAALSGVETPGGFAVPLDEGLQRVIEVLKRGEEVEYGFLGVRLGSEADPHRGVAVEGVVPGSPADREAQLRGGDRILTINGNPVRDVDDLFLLLGTSLAGSLVQIEVLPQSTGPKRTVSARLAKFYVPGPILAANRPPARFGLRVDYSSTIISQDRPGRPWGLRGLNDAVVIREVVPGSPADRARLQVDKVITRVNNNKVTTPTEFYQAIARAGRSVVLAVLDLDGREERVTLEGN